MCSPPFADPFIIFGGTDAATVRFIDSTTIEAVTPPHLPTRVSVTIRQLDGSNPFTLNDAFEFIGEPESAFEPILFPIFLPPIRGAFDSEFETIPRVTSGGPERVVLYGEDFSCLLLAPIHRETVYDPVLLEPDGIDKTLEVDCSTATGRIVWVRKETADSLAASLRVRDITRQALSHGTEVPVVRRDDFTTEKKILLGVPSDGRFRSTLRIYSLVHTTAPVNLSINGQGRQVFLQQGRSIFEPSFAVVSDFPSREEVDPIHYLDRVVILPSTVPLWGFVSVTNNDTQQITTITPN